MRALPPAAALAITLVAACAVNPATGEREFSLMSESQEIAIGRESDAQVRQEMGIYEDPDLQRYVSDIGMRLAALSERPNLPWQFTVVDVPAVNAFAIPGGFIYITRGILPFLANEAQLAGVLGHEIGHVTARHSAQQYSRAVGGTLGLAALGIFVPAARPFGQISEQALAVLFLKYGRDDELQADSLGARYAASGGWDPAGVPAFLSTLGRLDQAAGDRRGVPNWLSTHPEPLSRVDEVGPLVAELKTGRTDLSADRATFERQIDGLVFGDDPTQGVVRGSSFLHPELRFQLDFPNQWQVSNSPQQVLAKAPDAEVFMLLELVQRPQGADLRSVALGQMQMAGFRAVEGSATRVANFDAFLGRYQGAIEGLGEVDIRAAHVDYDGRVYLIAGIVPSSGFARADATFQTAIRSFRALSAREAEEIRPNLVDFYTVRNGDTWQSIAARSGGAITPEALAVMNEADPGSTPATGTRIKIVVGG